MALREGEIYRGSDPNCGCEITVTKSAPPTCKGTEQPKVRVSALQQTVNLIRGIFDEKDKFTISGKI